MDTIFKKYRTVFRLLMHNASLCLMVFISRILLGFLFGILSGKDREFLLEKMSVIHQIQLTCHAQLQIVDFEIIINKSNQLPQEIFQI